MNELKIFENPEFGKVRTVAIDGEPWFALKDVCQAFGETNYRRVASRLDEDEKGVSQIDTPGGKQSMTIVNESGLYAALFAMQPEKARGVSQAHIEHRQAKLKAFKRWVTSEVLPSIRKTGSYMTPQAQAVAPEVTNVLTELTKTQLATAETMRRLSERIATLERFKPKEVKVIQRAEPELSLSGLASLVNAARKATLDMGGSKWDAGVEVFRICSKYGIPIPPWAKSECKKDIGFINFEDFF